MSEINNGAGQGNGYPADRIPNQNRPVAPSGAPAPAPGMRNRQTSVAENAESSKKEKVKRQKSHRRQRSPKRNVRSTRFFAESVSQSAHCSL